MSWVVPKDPIHARSDRCVVKGNRIANRRVADRLAKQPAESEIAVATPELLE